MSTGRLYAYLAAGAAPTVLDFTMGLQDLEDEPCHERRDDFALSGRRESTLRRCYHRVTFLIERFCDSGVGQSALERRIASVTAHLGRGGTFGISRDHARSWAGLCSVTPSLGATTLATGGNGFVSWSSSAALASGDEVWIEGPGPLWPAELTTLTGAPDASGNVTLSEPLRYDYGADLFSGQPLVRWRDFFPICYRPTTETMKALVSWDKRRTYTFKLTFEYCPADALSAWPNHIAGIVPMPDTSFIGAAAASPFGDPMGFGLAGGSRAPGAHATSGASVLTGRR